MVLDPQLMYRVVIGVADPNASPVVRQRCEAAAAFVRWDGDRLWIRGGDSIEREVVPFCDRRALVARLATELGFPGGKRLYQLAKVRFYWAHMLRDCVAWCKLHDTNYVEGARFKPPPHLHPTDKASRPFH